MKISFNDMLYAISFALDMVEYQLLGVSTFHSPRVAYIATQMGRQFGLEKEKLSDLAACSIMHDNALTEYIREEYKQTPQALSAENKQEKKNFGRHCVIGEENIAGLPFFGDVKNSVLYHHENFNGSGPFAKSGKEIPFYAALIRLGDKLDTVFDLSFMNKEKYRQLILHLSTNTGVLYKDVHVEAFCDIFTLKKLESMQGEGAIHLLKASLPEYVTEYTPEELLTFPVIFAKIIDYKSHFTSLHSVGIAIKAKIMGEYYGFDKEHVAKLFLAGAFHDIGKMVVDNDILEKPASLTAGEFKQMRNHAYYSYYILSKINGFEEIARWASLHHEKLNGTGYPFGLNADQLGFEERLMACVDIYQALSEKRPYKESLPHQTVIQMMQELAEKGEIDGKIVDDIDKVFKDLPKEANL